MSQCLITGLAPAPLTQTAAPTEKQKQSLGAKRFVLFHNDLCIYKITMKIGMYLLVEHV